MDIKVQKIKLDGKGFPTIFYEQSSTYGDPECKLVGTRISEKLNEAMQDLLAIGLDWCRLGDDWKDAGRVIGVSLKHIEGDIGVTISLRGDFQDEIDNVPYAVNMSTPYLNPDRLTTVQHMALSKVCGEAEGYIKGQPIQLGLVA